MISKALNNNAIEIISKSVDMDDMPFWRRWVDDINYWIERKKYQFKQLKKWIPVIWSQYPWDFHYAIDVFRMKLEEIADCLESEDAMSLGAEYEASRIRLAIKLMDYVYGEKYIEDVHNEIVATYGEWTVVQKWERDYTEEEIKEIEKHSAKLYAQSYEKSKKAHKLLWKIIERHIQHWWD